MHNIATCSMPYRLPEKKIVRLILNYIDKSLNYASYRRKNKKNLQMQVLYKQLTYYLHLELDYSVISKH